EEAEKALREALRLRPELLATNINLANLLVQTGRLAEAKYHLERAVAIGPSAEEARRAYLQTLVATGRSEDAQTEYERALGGQMSDIYNNLGFALAGLRNLEESVRAYRKAVAASPESFTARLNLGLTLADQGALAEAEQNLDAAIQLKPDLFEAHLKLGQMLLSAGRSQAAAAHLQKAAQSGDRSVAGAAKTLLRSVK